MATPTPTPHPVAPTAKVRPRLWQRSGFRTALSLSTLLAVVGVCTTLILRANNYGARVQDAHPVDARIELANSPVYLDPRIIQALLDEAYQYAQRDVAAYDRARNTRDTEFLRALADLYIGTPIVDGQPVRRQAQGYNAWIRNITEVRRVVAADKSVQTIQIIAEWRQPEVWVRVNEALYLLDAQAVRLPGDYKLEDRGNSKMMVLTGIDLPVVAGRACVPQPGETWAAGKDGTLGADLLTGIQMARALARQPFAPQIAAINVANQGGRRDARAPWIALDTIWHTAVGTPRVVLWGRPIGEESFYDVKAEAKLKTLNEIYRRFNRIDAGRDYVDIHTEEVRLPKLALGATGQ